MDKAVVLMATYNGEKYVREQIDSILNQTYKNLELYIRDDGSSDGTLKILDSYADDSRVHIIKGSRLGYPDCFWSLFKDDIEADYYFFADQDDYWLPQKVEKAVEKLRKFKNKNVCYYSRYVICDSGLNKVSISPDIRNRQRLVNVLFEVPGLEFTMALTKKARENLLSNLPIKCGGRGTWMAMYFAGCGRIVTDSEPLALYRRHESTVTSSNMSFCGMFIWRFKQFILGNSLKSYKMILKEIKSVFYNELSDYDKSLVDLFTCDSYFKSIIPKLFFPRRLRRNVTDEISLRILFLLNRL